MKTSSLRAVALVAAVLAYGCTRIDLSTSYVPYACDPAGGDGGRQCANGWSCGFDSKCFDRDAGKSTAAAGWLCGDAGHCPDGWKCGVAIADAGYCTQLGVGAPSQCLTGEDCEGQWRCGHDQRCFNPDIPDGGALRDCSGGDAGDLQCPAAFRCGEAVDGVQRCIELDAGADSLCNTDRGCEGGRRCNTAAHVCVEVTDVVDPGALSNFGVSAISPLRREPVPAAISVSRVVTLPRDLIELPRPGRPPSGILLGEVVSGGVRIDAINLERDGLPDGGRQALVVTRFLPVPVANVSELVVTPTLVGLRFANDDVKVYSWGDGGFAPVTGLPPTANAIRAVERVVPRGYVDRSLLLIRDSLVFVDADGGAFSERVLFVDGGTTPAPLIEFVRQNSGDFAWDEGGFAFERDVLSDGGLSAWQPFSDFNMPVPQSPLRSAQVVTGIERNSARSFYLLRPDRQLLPYIPVGMSDHLATGVFAPCPSGGALLQLSSGFDPASGRTLPVAVCRDGDAGTPLSLTLRAETGMGGVERMKAAQYVTDLVPFQRPVVSATTTPFVRAHASINGLAWLSLDFDALSLPAGANLADQALHAMVLDRQPDTIVYVGPLGGVVVTAEGVFYGQEPQLGLSANFDPKPFNLLGVFENQPNWLMTDRGLTDLSSVTMGGTPTDFAFADGGPGVTLVTPATGFKLALKIDGVDHDVALIASGDKFWAGDVTSARVPFSSPALIAPIFVPQAGVPLRSLALVRPEPTDGGQRPGLRGFLTTNTTVMEFTSEDLVRWNLTPVVAPPGSQLPLEVWAEDSVGRVGTRDGIVWSLPIRVALTEPLTAADGGVLLADDFARHCGATFATTREGLFTLEAVDGGRPRWVSVAAVNAALDNTNGLRLFTANTPQGGLLYVTTRTGQVLQVTHSGPCP